MVDNNHLLLDNSHLHNKRGLYEMNQFKNLEIFAVYTPCLHGEDGDLQQHSIWLTFEKAAQHKENYDKAHEGYYYSASKILMDVRMLPDSIKSLFKQ